MITKLHKCIKSIEQQQWPVKFLQVFSMKSHSDIDLWTPKSSKLCDLQSVYKLSVTHNLKEKLHFVKSNFIQNYIIHYIHGFWAVSNINCPLVLVWIPLHVFSEMFVFYIRVCRFLCVCVESFMHNVKVIHALLIKIILCIIECECNYYDLKVK